MKPDALKGIRHFEDEELIAEVPVPQEIDKYWKLPPQPGGSFSAHLFNGTGEAYVVRIYRVKRSITLPKAKK